MTPTTEVTITPFDTAGTVLKAGRRLWSPALGMPFEKRLNECAGRAGRTSARLVVTQGKGTDELFGAWKIVRPNGKIALRAEPRPKPPEPKSSRAKKPAGEPRAKGHTFANVNKLPNNVGVVTTMQDLLSQPNPLSDNGWTARELAEATHKLFPARPLKGLMTTARCQIAKTFDSNIVIKRHKAPGDRETRYSI